MKKVLVQYFLNFLGLDESINDLASNQTKIMDSLSDLQESQDKTISLLDNESKQNYNYYYYIAGGIVILGLLIFFTSSGGDSGHFQAINNSYSEMSKSILKAVGDTSKIIHDDIVLLNNKISTVDLNAKNTIDIIKELNISQNEELNKGIYKHIFQAILTNTRHLEKITCILKFGNIEENRPGMHGSIHSEIINLANPTFENA